MGLLLCLRFLYVFLWLSLERCILGRSVVGLRVKIYCSFYLVYCRFALDLASFQLL